MVLADLKAYTAQKVLFTVVLLITDTFAAPNIPTCVAKPFNFQCYKTDVCKFPDEYCSSARHEQHCKPCHKRLCEAEGGPPLQCQQFCSSLLLPSAQHRGSDCAEQFWMKMSIALAVALVLVTIFEPFILWKCKHLIKMARKRNVSLQVLSKQAQTPRPHDNAENNTAPKHGPATTVRTTEEKLNAVSPTEGHGMYHPTIGSAKAARAIQERNLTSATAVEARDFEQDRQLMNNMDTAENTMAAAAGTTGANMESDVAEVGEDTCLLTVVTEGDPSARDSFDDSRLETIDEGNSDEQLSTLMQVIPENVTEV